MVLFLLIFYSLGVVGVYSLTFAGTTIRTLRVGVVGTIGLVLIVIPVGFLLGFTFGSGRTSHSWTVRAISTVYVEFFRSMPPLVLIAFTYLIVTTVILSIPALYLRIEDPSGFAITMGILALAFHSGAYQAEIIRAGIQSVPTGQRDAAAAIGLTRGKTMIYVVLPQMIRVSLPALGNEFASVIKDTSLLAAIGILELFYVVANRASDLITGGGGLDEVILLYIEMAFVYFALTFIVSRLLQAIERRYRVPGLEAAQL